MATKKPDAPRIAIIEQTPAGPLCRVTVLMSDAESVAAWTAKITASTTNAVTTKMLAGSAA